MLLRKLYTIALWITWKQVFVPVQAKAPTPRPFQSLHAKVGNRLLLRRAFQCLRLTRCEPLGVCHKDVALYPLGVERAL